MKTRTRVLLVLVVVVAVGFWYTVSSRSAAADAALTRQHEETQKLINAENQRHAAQLKNLDATRKTLKDAGASTQLVDALTRSEDDVHQARIDGLHHRLDLYASNLQRSLLSELRDMSRAIGSLNQSYEIPPVQLKNGKGETTAFTGGSKFIDYEDPIDRQIDHRDHQIDDEDGREAAAQPSVKADTRGQGEVPVAADAKEPAQPNNKDGLLGEVPLAVGAKEPAQPNSKDGLVGEVPVEATAK
ncbi:MAG: hypothetical protein HQ518_31500 [Rhodopirellula sp.]|nr:hypothetical protein [Rhodopirellula sp.]